MRAFDCGAPGLPRGALCLTSLVDKPPVPHPRSLATDILPSLSCLGEPVLRSAVKSRGSAGTPSFLVFAHIPKRSIEQAAHFLLNLVQRPPLPRHCHPAHVYRLPDLPVHHSGTKGHRDFVWVHIIIHALKHCLSLPPENRSSYHHGVRAECVPICKPERHGLAA